MVPGSMQQTLIPGFLPKAGNRRFAATSLPRSPSVGRHRLNGHRGFAYPYRNYFLDIRSLSLLSDFGQLQWGEFQPDSHAL